HSLNGIILDINEAVHRHLGYSTNEIIGKPISAFFNPKFKQKVEDYLKEVIQKGESSGFMYLVSKDGRPCIFDFRNSLITKDGQHIAIRGIARNVTEQYEIEKALRMSEKRFRDLFDNAPDMYIILNSKGIVIDFNQRGLSLLGFEKNDVLGLPFTSFIYEEDRSKVHDLFESIEDKKIKPKNIEVRMRKKNGQLIWISNEFSLVFNNQKQIQSIRVLGRDITEQKRLQSALARAQRLETAGRVAGQIAHDFNNLLAPLTAYPDLIREQISNSDLVRELLEEMESAAIKIADINQQLLALGRRGHYTMEPLNLNNLVEKILNSKNFPDNIKIVKYLSETLFHIKGGEAQLSRAFTNIINNAIEAMPQGGKLIIRTENVYLEEPLMGYKTINRGEYVKISIKDTGIGIPSENMDKIFDPFFTTKKMDHVRGSGLGLSVVHGIIEDHKGYILVSSKVNEGTTFELFFPITRDKIHLDIPQNVHSLKGLNQKILIVDDDPVQRRVASQILKHLGYKVSTAQNGEEALHFIKSNPQDLVILDMIMNGLDGTETYKKILQIYPHQKALILSGYAKSNRVKEAMRLGAVAFISKPIKMDVLAKAVYNALNQS
ncbi:MAG: PAS domain-containing sensor histidine kinase, partial [Calditrichaeota bacterium]